MTAKIFVVLALCFLAVSVSGSHMKKHKHSATKKELNSEAHYQALKETPFGKNLFNMLTLKFKTTGAVDSILELLDELNTNIVAQQADDDNNFAVQSASLQEQIDENNAVVVDSDDKINRWGEEKAAAVQTRSEKTDERNSKAQQIEDKEANLAQLAEIRAAENAAYLQRVNDQKAILEGLDTVIALFTTELENDENLDKDTGDTVLDLLNEVREGLVNSLADDTQDENNLQIAYNNYVDEQTALIEQLQEDVENLDAELEGLDELIDTLSENIEAQEATRQNALDAAALAKSQLDAATQLHADNTSVRNDQIVLLGQVKARLRAAGDDVDGVLNA